MSNVASTAISTKNQPKRPHMGDFGNQQKQINIGSRSMLDEARNTVENAVGQGQMLDPMIYQMLGLQPTYEDHTADLQQSQQELDAAQNQFNEAKNTLNTLKAIPANKRTAAQRKQINQLKRQTPKFNTLLENAKDKHGQLMSSPKTITGLERLDENLIPDNSPFSPKNPLNQAQKTEEQRLNQYLAGDMPVDPSLIHKYDASESALRAKLASRFGPDYENSSVGQMALQNFARTKNEAMATWNQDMVQKYHDLAFGDQANLQKLLAGQIGLMREPASDTMAGGAAISNLVGQRLAAEGSSQQRLAAIAGLPIVANTGAAPIVSAAGGSLSNILTTPYQNAQGQNTSLLGQGTGALYNWLSGGGAGAAATGLGADAALANAATAGVGAGMSAEGVGAGMSAAGGGSILGAIL